MTFYARELIQETIIIEMVPLTRRSNNSGVGNGCGLYGC